MTGRLKTMDKENEIESDWKFAAMVIDRSLPTSLETWISFKFNLSQIVPLPTLITFKFNIK